MSEVENAGLNTYTGRGLDHVADRLAAAFRVIATRDTPKGEAWLYDDQESRVYVGEDWAKTVGRMLRGYVEANGWPDRWPWLEEDLRVTLTKRWASLAETAGVVLAKGPIGVLVDGPRGRELHFASDPALVPCRVVPALSLV